MPRIGVIAGVRSEAGLLAMVASGPDAPIIRLSGARPVRAERAAGELLALGVEGLLSFGTAGGLSPTCPAGTVIVASSVIAPNGESFQTAHAWRAALETAAEVVAQPVAGSDDVVGPTEKRRLFAHTHAVAVDMESHIVGRVATAAGVPFAVLRAIVDPADFEIPGWVLDGVRPDGSISLLPVLAGLCLQPWKLGALIDLSANNRRASESLRRVLGLLGPGLGFLAR